MGSGLLQYGEWSPAVWGVVSCSMGSGLLQYGEWSPAVWGVVSCSMGSGLLQYGEDEARLTLETQSEGYFNNDMLL